MRILLINSDLAKNRGDRAIAEGVIDLIRRRHAGAKITGISERAERDREWFGIEFLKADVQSVNPLDWIRLGYEASRSEIVYWGGGEYLKDYTNKVTLWYWCIKVLWLRIFNRNVYGIFQGIGPTGSTISKRLIVFIVNRTRKFVLRDNESYEKLRSWGVSPSKIDTACDPAILPKPGSLSRSDIAVLDQLGISKQFLDDFIAFAPRNWFHYRTGGILPYRYRRLFSKGESSPRNEQYKAALRMTVEAIAECSSNILVLPMHMGEDVTFCDQIVGELDRRLDLKVLREDVISPRLLRTLLAAARLMVGIRLHSTIVATSGHTPSVSFYYVDKGRAYFDQLGLGQYAFPIENLLLDEASTFVPETIARVLHDAPQLSMLLATSIDEQRQMVSDAFGRLVE